jgi:hypothetical protein
MSNKFDELTKSMAQSVTRRAALRKFGIGMAGMALACFGLANKAGAGSTNCFSPGSHCQHDSQCCSGTCSDGYCACAPAGSPCRTYRDCCSGLTCFFGHCRAPLRFP